MACSVHLKHTHTSSFQLDDKSSGYLTRERNIIFWFYIFMHVVRCSEELKSVHTGSCKPVVKTTEMPQTSNFVLKMILVDGFRTKNASNVKS